MALITCPECKNEVSSKASLCPKCGSEVPKECHDATVSGTIRPTPAPSASGEPPWAIAQSNPRPIIGERYLSEHDFGTDSPDRGNTATKPPSKRWIWVIAVVVLGVISLVGSQLEKGERKKAQQPLPLATLPATAPNLGEVLGQTRAHVRKALGSTSATSEGAEGGEGDLPFDDFGLGSGVGSLTVIYYQGRAVQLSIITDGKRQDIASTRRWLGIPPAGDIKIGGRSMRISSPSEDALWVQDAGWAEAQAKRDEVASAKAEAVVMQARRKQIAAVLDQNFLANGLDATVRVDGTVLRIEWVLCNRASLYQLLEGGKPTLATRLGDIGFTRVVCYTGYDTGAYQDLRSSWCTIDGKPGQCIELARCSGTHAAQLCPGFPDDVQCCVQ